MMPPTVWCAGSPLLAMHQHITVTAGTPTLETFALGLQRPSQISFKRFSVVPTLDGTFPLHPFRHSDSCLFNARSTQHLAKLAGPDCCGTRCARIATKRYVRHAAGTWLLMRLRILCIDPTTRTAASVVYFFLPSYCTTTGGDPIAEYLYVLHDFLQYTLYSYLHLLRCLIRSDELLNQNHCRSAIGAERTFLIPSNILNT